MSETAQELVFNTDNIVVFDEFKSQLSELKELNESVVFDYESPAGNKEARSHVYKLRGTKSAIESKRKEAKKISMDYGKKIDEKAKEISSQIEEMINVHDAPIKAIEAKENERVAKIKTWMAEIAVFKMTDQQKASEQLQKDIDNLESLRPTKDQTGDFFVQIMTEYKSSLLFMTELFESKVQYEKDQAELQKLRDQQAERDRLDNEKRIANEAAELAKLQAQEDAKNEFNRMVKEKEDAEVAAEQARIKAEQDAETERQRLIQQKEQAEARELQAIENAAREQREAEELKVQQEQQRRDDEEHKRRIDDAIKSAMVLHANPIGGGVPDKIIEAINAGLIPNVKIEY